MKKWFALLFTPLAAAPAAEGAGTRSAGQEVILGAWQNPRHSITVQTSMCGEELCGTIVAATEEALQDAQDSGVQNLIGMQLLRAYRRDTPVRWTGTVYVPDMGRSFYSHIVVVSPTKLRISGCVLGGWICKSQEWTRL